MDKILIATKNQGKVADFKTLFDRYKIKVISLLDIDPPIDDVEETGDTFSENAMIKAETIANHLNLPVLADDSGLAIDYLSGRPGVYSARYAGLDKDDQKNNLKVLRELEGVPHEERTAKFICALAFAVPGHETVIKYGTCQGKMTTSPIGENGFGYDPIFIPDGYHQTMAQLSTEAKNEVSHRGQAIKAFASWLDLQEEVGF